MRIIKMKYIVSSNLQNNKMLLVRINKSSRFINSNSNPEYYLPIMAH